MLKSARFTLKLGSGVNNEIPTGKKKQLGENMTQTEGYITLSL